MANDTKPVKVTSESDLMRLLDEAESRSPVLLERHGVVYQLNKVDEKPVHAGEPDAGEVGRILDETLGSWAHLDINQMIEDLYRARREGSRPPDRP